MELTNATYPQVYEGEWVRPIRRGYKLRCCDCGLVHRMNFRVLDGRIEFQPFRDNRATAAVRRAVPRRDALAWARRVFTKVWRPV